MKVLSKPFVILIATILAVVILCGIMSFQKAEAYTNIGFEVLYGGTWDMVQILYDRETGVMYAKSNGAKNNGTMTVMVNPDGTPRVYEGFSGK